MDIKCENVFKEAGGQMHLVDFQGMPRVDTGEQQTAAYRLVHLEQTCPVPKLGAHRLTVYLTTATTCIRFYS